MNIFFKWLLISLSCAIANINAIHYPNLIAKTEFFRDVMQQENVCQRLKMLAQYGKYDRSRSMIRIDNVPLINGTVGYVTLALQLCGERYDIRLYDSAKSECFSGYIWLTQSHKSVLKMLCATPQTIAIGDGSDDDEQDIKRLISGTVAMHIWDAMCDICAVGRVKLTDCARYDTIKLRVLLPYIYGCSWYGKWGYAVVANEAEYKEAINFLRERTYSDLLHDFADNTEIFTALTACLAYSGSNATESLGTVLTAFFTKYRRVPEDERASLQTLLECVYTHCLIAYKTARESKDGNTRITHYQIILDSFQKFAKIYART